MDNLVIPKNAPHAELAHQLIDFILRPDMAQIIVEKIGYTSPNAEAVKRLPPALSQDPTLYPDAQKLAEGEFQTDIGPAIKIYADYWEKLKAE